MGEVSIHASESSRVVMSCDARHVELRAVTLYSLGRWFYVGPLGATVPAYVGRRCLP